MPASKETKKSIAENGGDARWYVYLALCADGSEYCGICTDPDVRMKKHNGELPGGAKYTRTRRPVTLEHAVGMPSKSAALKAERTVKCLPKAQKLAFLKTLGTTET
ncbi:MAG: GIY-YIG nuclease family protein [Mailhella sp.]|nr:GIY-YIG nuclease family protein [Mailhella sp.]